MPRVEIDFEREGLLKGTRGKRREARLKLLQDLSKSGVSLDELRRAVEEDRLVLLPVERVLSGGKGKYTADEVAKRSGVSRELLDREWQALGFAMPDDDEASFTGEDLKAAKRIKSLEKAGVPPDGVIEVARVLGIAMSQVAAANRGLIGEAFLRAGDTELDAATRFAEVAKQLLPMLGETLTYVLALHLREQLRHDAIGSGELASGKFENAQEVTVCFADLVDFTRLGEQFAVEQLGTVTGRLNELAGDVAKGPVRLVKMIGDAAMLVSRDNDAALDAALRLVESSEEEGEEFPMLRAGLARGPALARGGDWYGRPVNMASRITEIARAGSVLCAETVHECADADFSWSFARERKLKGFDEGLRLFRARRGSDGSRAGDGGDSATD